MKELETDELNTDNNKLNPDNIDNIETAKDHGHGRKYCAAVINLGCKVNRYEADSMKRIMADSGIALVNPEDIADFYIVNTCSVTNIAERKSRQMLRRAKRRNPEAVVIAAGCYVNAAHDELLALDFVDAVIGNDRKNEIMNVIQGYINNSNEAIVKQSYKEEGYNTDDIPAKKPDKYVRIDSSNGFEEMGELTASYLDHQRAYIKVQDGCNQFCSYCIIPYTRGRIRSRMPDNIIEEIAGLAKSGVKEFVLTGIHISSYGRDFVDDYSNEIDQSEEARKELYKVNGSIINDLGDLICAVSDIPEVRRIRLGSIEPRIITDAFLSKISRAEKLCPHFHLSLQSACNATLKRMNRKYTIEEYIKSCELIRSYYDRPAITTDVIVGFPGETEEEFDITVANLEALRLYEIHVFKYSVRRGTVAEKMPDQVPDNVKNIRSDILLELTKRQKKDYEISLEGLTDEVLIEEEMFEGAGVDEVKQGDNSNMALNTPEYYVVSDGQQWVDKGEKRFTGYTKRYVRVEVVSNKDIVGEILPFTF